MSEHLPFQLRRMTTADIPDGMRLKRAANWNQQEQDWALFLRAGQEGCMVAEKDGKVVGTVTSINYAGRFSWIGMLLVDPSSRRLGIGTTLLKEAIRLAEHQGTIRLDATPQGKLLYDTLGFQDEYLLSRYQLKYCNTDMLPEPAPYCRPMTFEDMDKIRDLDTPVFGASRSTILSSLYDMGRNYAWIYHTGDRITGFCLGRPGSNFEQIGPIVSSDQQSAIALLLQALGQCQGKPVIIDVPDEQKAFRSFVEGLGFEIQRPFIRMYLGTHRFRGLPEMQYAIAGPEIG